MNIADLKARFGERLEGLSGDELDCAVIRLLGKDPSNYRDDAGVLLHAPSINRNALAEAEAQWLTTLERSYEYDCKLGLEVLDRTSELQPLSAIRLLPPDVCCRCLLLAAMECE